MSALDFLTERGLSARRHGMRVRVSPRAKITDEVRRYVIRNRLVLLVELESGDGLERRCCWSVVLPGHRPFTMISEPITYDEALADIQSRWPGATIQ